MADSDRPQAFPIAREDVPVLRRVMIQLTPLAIGALVQNMVSKDSTPAEKRKCAELILAYGHGRPVNTTVIEEKANSNIIIDQGTVQKLQDTFERINTALGKTLGIPNQAHTILAPILESEGLLEELASINPVDKNEKALPGGDSKEG